MIEVLHSGMMELDTCISKSPSTIGRMHKHLWMRITVSIVVNCLMNRAMVVMVTSADERGTYATTEDSNDG